MIENQDLDEDYQEDEEYPENDTDYGNRATNILVKPWADRLAKVLNADADRVEFWMESNGAIPRLAAGGREAYFPQMSGRIFVRAPRIGYGESAFQHTVYSANFGQLPSCCGFAFLHNCCAGYSFRYLGIDKIMRELFVCLAEAYGYGGIIATDTDSKRRNKTLLRDGWKIAYTIRNPRTGNLVNTWIYDFKYDESGNRV